MKIYNYDALTKEFISEGVAYESPLEEGVYLIPANATEIVPIAVEEGYVNCFNGNKWEPVKDNRGIWYNVIEEIKVTELDYDVTGLTRESVPFTDEELAKIEADRIARETKEAKELALATITVEVNGKVFDGRDKDQVRMMAAIQTADILGLTKAEWKLNNDIIVEITLDELKQALALSIQRVGEIVKGL